MNEKKKILYVITKSNYGGAQRYVHDLATRVPRHLYEVVVALGGTGERDASTGSLKTELEKSGIRTVVIKNFMRNMSLGSDVRAFIELLKVIRREKPDILHASSSKAGGLGVLAGRLMRTPTILFTSHGLTFDESWRQPIQRVLIWLFTWFTVLLAHTTILISADNLRRVQRMPFVRNKVTLVHNGIVRPEFKTKEEARSTLCSTISDSEPWIGVVAEYHPNKNLGALIHALTILQKDGLLAHLVLIGEGEERDRLEQLAKECGVTSHVHITGQIDEAANYLQAFDVFTLPSKKEGLPYVLIEAGFAGLPIVASDIPGNREVIEGDVSGTLVEPTPEKIAIAFRSLLSDKEKAATYGAALQQRVQRMFSIENMVQKTTQLYTPSNPSISRSKSSRRTERS